MKIRKYIAIIAITAIAFIYIFPLIATITNSFMSNFEINDRYGKLLNKSNKTQSEMIKDAKKEGSNDNISIGFIPRVIDVEQYYETLIEKYDYISMFWNSVKIALIIAIGSLIFAFPQAYIFAKIPFRFSNAIFFTYIIVMLMPFQVTLLPNYILLKGLNLLNTHWALILPAIFSPFGVFLLTQFMRYVPNDVVESYRLESNSVIGLYTKIIAPMAKPGIIALLVLTFAESWNMVEQPLIFLKDEYLYPLSLALNSPNLQSQLQSPFAGAVIYVIPIIVLYFYFEEEIIQGFGNWKF